MDRDGFRLIIAGGKTGGHLFPGIAVAQAVKKLEPGAQILFVGCGSTFEVETLAAHGFIMKAIDSAGIKGKGLLDKIRGAAMIPLSLFQAMAVIRKFRPDMVLGVGGYSSGSVVLAARIFFPGCITGIQEQNSIPGATNRILARLVHVIFTGFRDTRGFSASPKTIHTGNPVRRPASDVEAETHGSGRPGCFTILVTGGSQGASSINRAFADAMALVEDKESLMVIHQTGRKDEARVREAYDSMGLPARVGAFFDNMPELMANAHLIVCRAGAGTISEITAKGRPALLVPYPYAADDHQRFNAETLVRAGAGVMVLDRELSGEKLHGIISDLMGDLSGLDKMAERAKALGMPGAGDIIAKWCLDRAKRG